MLATTKYEKLIDLLKIIENIWKKKHILTHSLYLNNCFHTTTPKRQKICLESFTNKSLKGITQKIEFIEGKSVFNRVITNSKFSTTQKKIKIIKWKIIRKYFLNINVYSTDCNSIFFFKSANIALIVLRTIFYKNPHLYV